MSDCSFKTEYITEAVRLEFIGDIAFDSVKTGDNIHFRALCDSSVTPVIEYNGEKITAKNSVYTVSVVENGVLTVDAVGMTDCQNHKAGVGLGGEDLTSYNHDLFMKPFYEGDTVYHEAVMFSDSADGIVQKEKKLLFPIDDVISVRNNNLDKWYVLGVDYEVINGKLVFIDGGACPIWKGNFIVPADEADSFVDPALNVGTSGKAASWYRTEDGGDKGLNLIYDAYHEKCTLYVTYKHTKTWADLGEEGYAPITINNQSEKIQNFYEKLLSGEDINVLVYGDSTATGCASTGMLANYDLFSREPDEKGEYEVMHRKGTGYDINAPTFFEMATNELIKKYGKGNTAKFYNIANGGVGAPWGKLNVLPRVEFMDKFYGEKIIPDVIYIKFMANDIRSNPEKYRESYESIVRDFKNLYPYALIIMVSGKINNERSFIYSDYHDNQLELQKALCFISDIYENCVVVKATDFWVEALKSKDYEDYLSNNINHANDYWAATTAQLIVATVSKN